MDPFRMEWFKVDDSQPRSQPLGRRCGHTCNVVGNLLYVFGGNDGSRNTNDVHVFDTANGKWSKPLMSGSLPSPRCNHTCSTFGDVLIIFGGADGSMTVTNDLYFLHTSHNLWCKLHTTGQSPVKRFGHSAAFCDLSHKLYIFGGCSVSDTNQLECLNSLHMYAPASSSWTSCSMAGEPPCPRFGHTCSYWEGKLIVIGGQDLSGNYFSDIHIFYTGTQMWMKLETPDLVFPPRSGHATVSAEGSLFVFGGRDDDNEVYQLKIDSGTFTNVLIHGGRPSPRVLLAGDCTDSKNYVFLLMGGSDGVDSFFDDILCLRAVPLTLVISESSPTSENLGYSGIEDP
ncbi:hypothetical protein J5N97_008419 [Dioscorea zingiberensis]|uniref:Uncharacterized protein n=1 Tax=Dioscorea zingiberensis TaxID=325984 RepID=A0A9D5HKT5_9LILI|nr:hypothetical protein J5N97_008419 [Dioscorea zingiberensis]